jgi:hypothetical protein
MVALITLVACNEAPKDPVSPELSLVPGTQCAADPDFVATDRDSFLDALTHAQPGETIAVDGMIELDFDGNVETPGVTFDCASPGSGLSAAPGVGVWLFIVKAPGVTVQNLVLDARGGEGAYLSDKNGVDAFAEGLVFRGNTVTCNSPECVFVQSPEFGSASGALVENNVVEASGGGEGRDTGIHIQGYTDVTLLGNSVRTSGEGLRAIAVNGSSHVLVRENRTAGPWGRALVLWDGVYDSDFSSNTFAGARNYGATFEAVERIRFSGNTTECGAVACILARQGADVRIEDNTFTSRGSATVVHTQGGLDRVSILRNRLLALEPATDLSFGGIRLRTGSGHVVEGNEVRGFFFNDTATTEITRSRFSRNEVVGPLYAGGLFQETHDNQVGANIISKTGGPGVVVNVACRNVFLGNNLQLAGAPGLAFGVETGANTYIGAKSVVVDNGSFDCDGDGLVDPNVLSGQGVPLFGVPAPQVPGVTAAEGLLR